MNVDPSDEFTDVELKCTDGVVIKCHRLLLAFICQFFNTSITTGVGVSRVIEMQYPSLVLNFVFDCIYHKITDSDLFGCGYVDAIMDCVNFLQVYDKYKFPILHRVVQHINTRKKHSRLTNLLVLLCNRPEEYDVYGNNIIADLVDNMTPESVMVVIAARPEITLRILNNTHGSACLGMYNMLDDSMKDAMRANAGFMMGLIGAIPREKVHDFFRSEVTKALQHMQISEEKPQIMQYLRAFSTANGISGDDFRYIRALQKTFP